MTVGAALGGGDKKAANAKSNRDAAVRAAIGPFALLGRYFLSMGAGTGAAGGDGLDGRTLSACEDARPGRHLDCTLERPVAVHLDW